MNAKKERIIYIINYRQYDGTAPRDELLGAVRRAFFKTGITVADRQESIDSGLHVRTHYKIGRHCFTWEKKCGEQLLQCAYRVKDGYELCTWNLQGEPVSRASYSMDHIWKQTAYYARGVQQAGKTVVPTEVLRPGEENRLLLLKRMENGKYSKTELAASELHPGTAEQSLVNDSAGEPLIYGETSLGSFCYCIEEEAKLREQLFQKSSASIPLDFTETEESEEETSSFEYIENDTEPETEEPESPKKEEEKEELSAALAPDYPANREVLRIELEGKPAKYAVAAKNRNGVVSHAPELVQELGKNKVECIKCPEDMNRLAEEAERSVFARADRTQLNDLPMPVKRIVVSAEESYTYFGEILDGLREGNGRTQMANGHTAYEGGYHADKRDGFGTYYYKSGKISYVGRWKENRRHGMGVSFSSRDGSVFVGKWENNIPTGKGSAFDASGNLLYTGDWKDGKRCGTGTEYRAGREYYIGEWENDRWNGQGTLKLANGTVITGLFENGKVKGLQDESKEL